jgi:Protein of unknown function (DUF3375)
MTDSFFAYEKLKHLFSEHRVFQLLRKDTAPLITAFLYQVFKVEPIPFIKNQELVKKLAEFLLEQEPILYPAPENALAKAKLYLEQWANEEILRQYPNNAGEPINELTTYSERALRWLDSLKPKTFVGTESRFRSILHGLNELVEEAVEDPIRKIQELELKKATFIRETDEKIEQIKQSGKVEAFSVEQLEDQYSYLTQTARDLIADFKEVESNFKKIAQEIYQNQLGQFQKGKLLGQLLDEIDKLEQSPQGKSFYGFWAYLRQEDRQSDIYDLARRVFTILKSKQIPTQDRFLLDIKNHLFEEGRKVLTSNNLMIERLYHLMSEKRLRHRMKALELTSAIQQWAVQNMDNPPKTDAFFTIEALNPKLDWTWERSLQSEPPLSERGFRGRPTTSEEDLLDDAALFQHFEINKNILIQNIENLLKERTPISLNEVLTIYPLTQGVAELVTYYAIAPHFQYQISDIAFEKINLNNVKNQFIKSPQLIFTR